MICSVDGCERLARGNYCPTHRKRQQRGRPLSGPIAERPKTKLGVLREAALRYAHADSDEEFAKAEANLIKASARAALEAKGEVIRQRLCELRKQGAKLGRPPKADPARAAELVKALGIARAAEHLGVSRRTVERAVRVGAS